jgi:hypothetical protein
MLLQQLQESRTHRAEAGDTKFQRLIHGPQASAFFRRDEANRAA